MKSENKKKAFQALATLSILILSGPLFFTLGNYDQAAHALHEGPCNCVIFRLDDVRYPDFHNKSQIAVMNLFIAEKEKLTIGIIVNNLTSTTNKVLDKIKEGHSAGLFELGIHGYSHANHSKLTREQQITDFNASNAKLQRLFGETADIFLPPLNFFNQGTIEAMAATDLEIMATRFKEEQKTLNPYKISERYDTGSTVLQLSSVNGSRIYHVPFNGTSILLLQMQGFADQRLIDEVMSAVNYNINKNGFSVIALHPSDFSKYDASKGYYVKQVDPTKFDDLAAIIDRIQAQGNKIVSFHDIMPPLAMPPSSPREP